MRQRNKPWADDFLKQNQHIVIPDPSENKHQWGSVVFGNNHPIHIEIGTGKGRFLAGMAKQFPEINFIGVELAKNIIVTAAQKVITSEQKNVRLINENAEKIGDVFADNEVSAIYLNFSDPWPKNRHEKRRLTYRTFLEKYQAILKAGGEVSLKTDNQALFEYSLVSFSGFGMILKDVSLDLHDKQDSQNIMTEYEEKFSNAGQRIYRCRAVFNEMEADKNGNIAGRTGETDMVKWWR